MKPKKTASQVSEPSEVCTKPEAKEAYEPPKLTSHGEWQALTLQFSIPIALEDDGY